MRSSPCPSFLIDKQSQSIGSSAQLEYILVWKFFVDVHFIQSWLASCKVFFEFVYYLINILMSLYFSWCIFTERWLFSPIRIFFDISAQVLFHVFDAKDKSKLESCTLLVNSISLNINNVAPSRNCCLW